MGAERPAAASAEAAHEPACGGSPASPQRHALDPAHGRFLGGPAGALRFCVNGIGPVLPLAQGACVRPCAAAAAGLSGYPRGPRLGPAFCGRHGGARPQSGAVQGEVIA